MHNANKNGPPVGLPRDIYIYSDILWSEGHLQVDSPDRAEFAGPPDYEPTQLVAVCYVWSPN